MKISFIATVYNEEKNLEEFISSVFLQTKKPDEVIIVDGGSSDNTSKILKRYKDKITVLKRKGNRSLGRNTAIKHAKFDTIAVSDSGCVLDKNWLKNITEPFRNRETKIVAGYYKGRAKTVFQQCLVPYVLVMPDRLDAKTFLPATRSMAFRKKVWERIGGFDEDLSNNEDYAFSKKARDQKVNIAFKKDAIVYWIPRDNLKDAYKMFFRFAKGDIEAGILRPKVVLLIVRVLVGIAMTLLLLWTKSILLLHLFLFILLLYLFWAIYKNYKYVGNVQAVLYLPVLQFASDCAVFLGTFSGFLAKISDHNSKLI